MAIIQETTDKIKLPPADCSLSNNEQIFFSRKDGFWPVWFNMNTRGVLGYLVIFCKCLLLQQSITYNTECLSDKRSNYDENCTYFHLNYIKFFYQIVLCKVMKTNLYNFCIYHTPMNTIECHLTQQKYY